MEDLVGKVFGKYRIVGRLGRGGMADVYEAFQVNLERHVALKLMHPHLAEEPGFVERFEREAKNAAALRHPNIVQIFDFDIEGQTPYIVMELIEGLTVDAYLADRARRGEPLPLAEQLRLIGEVGQALAYAHQRNLVHRDVKPGNAMVDVSGRVILTDFGLSKILSVTARTATGSFVGTPAYMAPEVGQGLPGDHRADIYALGVMLFEIVTGKLPYEADSPIAVVLKHITEPIPSPRKLKPDLPDMVESVILTCLAKDPDERYQTMGEVLAKLALCLEALPAAGPAYAVVAMPEVPSARLTDLPTTHFAGETAPAAEAAPTVEAAPPEPTLPPSTANFVGREAELARYAAQLTERRLVVLSGMPGMGKTALAAALAARVSDPARTFWHTFHAGEGVNALLWKLAAFLAWRGKKDLWRRMEAGSTLPPAEVLFDFVFQALRGADYLLCFDDFHHIETDPLLAQFIQRLQTALQAGELSLIIASRRTPDFAGEEECLELAGLSLSDTDRLLALRGLTLAREQADVLHKYTEGNAQFLVLSVDNLRKSANPARLLSRLSESDNVERFLMKEVDQSLSEEEREVMCAVATLLGYPGTRDALSALLDGRSVRRVLNELHSRFLVTETEGEAGREYGQHAMVQAYYYDLLDKRERQAMHRRAGEYYATEEPDPLKAAQHFQRAGEHAKAVQWATEDVWRLINRGQAQALQQVLEQFAERDLDQMQWALVNLTRGQVAQFLGDLEAGRASYQAAHTLFAAMPDSKNARVLRARACLEMGELLQTEQPDEALDWLRRGREELQGADACEEAALRIRTGRILSFVGKPIEAEAELQAGLALLPPEPSRLRMTALGNLANIYCTRGEIDRGLAYYQQIEDIAGRLNDIWLLMENWLNLGIELDIAGRWAEALDYYRRAAKEADRLGSLSHQCRAASTIGNTYAKLGDLATAEQQLERGLAIARSKTWQSVQVFILISLAGVQVQQNHPEAAEPLAAEAERLAQLTGVREPLPELYYAWALARLQQGQPQAALDYANQALTLARELQSSVYEGVSSRVVGQARQALSQRDAACASFEQSLRLLAARDPLEAARTKVEYGRCLQAAGETARGLALLQEAQEAFGQLGAQYDLRQLETPLN